MAEEYTCIECENLYNDRDGDTDERLCNKCGCQIYEEDHHSSVYHGVDNIQNENTVRISDINKEIAKEWRKNDN